MDLCGDVVGKHRMMEMLLKNARTLVMKVKNFTPISWVCIDAYLTSLYCGGVLCSVMVRLLW